MCTIHPQHTHTHQSYMYISLMVQSLHKTYSLFTVMHVTVYRTFFSAILAGLFGVRHIAKYKINAVCCMHATQLASVHSMRYMYTVCWCSM